MTEPDHNQTILLDVHAHLVPVVPQRLEDVAGASWDPKTRALSLDGRSAGPSALFQPDRLTSWMDLNRIQHAWVSIPPPAYRPQLDEASAREWVHYVNDGLTEIAERSGGRFSALLHLPVEHPTLAAEIAATGEKFSMSTGGGEHIRLSDLVYEPLWSALDRRSAFLFIHPGSTCDSRLDQHFLRNLLGNPVETGVAASHLLMGGVLERHRNMTVCLAHGGGILAAIAGRIDHGYSAGMIQDVPEKPSPAASLRRLCVDCITHDPSVLRLAANVFGEDHLYFGSDWPFPMGLLDPHNQLAVLDPATRHTLFDSNPSALLKRLSSPPPCR